MHFRDITKKFIVSLLAVTVVMPTMAMADLNKVNNSIGFDLTPSLIEFAPDNSNQELVEGFVRRLYQTIQNREADNSGLNFWVGCLTEHSVTGAYVASRFFESPEFKAKNTTNEEYVTILYRAFFGREPDRSGKAFWLSNLEDGVSRAVVTDFFINSDEWRRICSSYGIVPGSYLAAISGNPQSSATTVPTAAPTATVAPTAAPTATVTVAPTTTPASTEAAPTLPPVDFGSGIEGFVRRMYSYCLGRNADNSGLEFYVSNLTSGRLTGATVTRSFFYSAEFTRMRANMTDEEVLTTFYRVFFNRTPDASGFAFWLEVLGRDNGFELVYQGMLKSYEFLDICESYGVTPGFTMPPRSTPVPVDANFARWAANQQLGIQRLNSATNLTPTRTYQSIDARGATSIVTTTTISDREWQICDDFARSHFDPSWTPGEKVAYTMYWIHYNVTYASGSGWNAIAGMGPAEAIFTRRVGQCAQYNGALTTMMCYLGYDCAMIQSYRGTSTSNRWSHYWNEVYINGETYINEVGNQGHDGSWWYLTSLYSETRKFMKNGVVLGY